MDIGDPGDPLTGEGILEDVPGLGEDIGWRNKRRRVVTPPPIQIPIGNRFTPLASLCADNNTPKTDAPVYAVNNNNNSDSANVHNKPSTSDRSNNIADNNTDGVHRPPPFYIDENEDFDINIEKMSVLFQRLIGHNNFNIKSLNKKI